MDNQSDQTKTKRVLVVEDDQFLRDLYVELLKGERLTVDEAIDGEEALAKMQTGGYDLVLLDIGLPKMDGLQVLQAITAQPPANPNKKIVILTNMGQESVVKGAQEHGVAGYLIKSALTPDQFLTEVGNYLKQ